MDFNLKNLNPKIWEKARIKGIKEKVSISKVLRQLLKMWVDGEVRVTFPEKPGTKKK